MQCGHYAAGGLLGGVLSSAGVSDGGGAAASGVGSAEGAGVSACNSGGIFSTTFDCQLKNTILETYRVR